MSNHEHAETRERLLNAAGEVFAEKGFAQATVREICQRAGANVAAINYYFGDKEGLYTEILRVVHSGLRAENPAMAALCAGGPAEERLRACVHGFLRTIFNPDLPRWHEMICAREMTEPTPAFLQLVDEIMRARFDALTAVVRELLGPAADEGEARLCAHSIIGQCVYHHICVRLIARIEQQAEAEISLERLGDHITEFSLAALRSAAQRYDGKGVHS